MVGLSSTEAAAALARDGPNTLPAPRRRPAVWRFARQFLHFFAIMLWVAAGLALVAGIPQLAAAIAAVIALNGTFAFVQEHRADRAAERLSAFMPAKVTVRRDGRRTTVDAGVIVKNDVLLLESGDWIPADSIAQPRADLRVDTSLLTGESEATTVEAGGALYAGTFVVEGEGEALVVATGGDTRLAGIARLSVNIAGTAGPLARELRRVVRTISAVAIGVGIAFYVVEAALGIPTVDRLVFGIGVTVALIPEALLPTVTLALAWGAEQMAHRRALVRHLEAVETLGSTTFICTDKTGTLTLNQMTVVEAWTPNGRATVDAPGYSPKAPIVYSGGDAADSVARLARAGALCGTGYVFESDEAWRPHGDPMEAALDAFAHRVAAGWEGNQVARPPMARFPFDPRRRRMSVVVEGMVLVKGASDSVLPLCGDDPSATAAVTEFTERGLRVLAVAGRPAGSRLPATAAEAENELELYGLVALEDPPRPDVRASILACRRAGIKIAMITGDHPATAAAIAFEVGLRNPNDLVLTGAELPPGDDELGALIDRDGVVIARVSPEDKLRIARALRLRDHVVAMTGDGVNDGPALREADIGIAMGASGTDVAREAADLVLLDDHFATIVAGVEQGRATFLNIRRFLTYHLTDNVAEVAPFIVWALSGGRFPLALGVLQILAIDIATDTFSAVALGAEPPGRRTLDRPPVRGRLLNQTVARRAFGLLGPTIAVFTLIAFVASFLSAGWRPGQAFPGGDVLTAASGAAFMTVVIAQGANALACRSSTTTPGALGWATNPLLLGAVGLDLLIGLATLYIPPVADALGHSTPPLIGWIVAFTAAGAVLLADRIDKRRRARHRTR
ncbi:cation-transporting P-type ATPase [Glycomyces sp. YM15]|uniref:cation-translocating P-type ATPase n=1 Tax=Glycomyces sp. YM15 TaxID=2800446 RepID=UPI001F060590